MTLKKDPMKKAIFLALIILLASHSFGQKSFDLNSLVTRRYVDSIGKEVVEILVPGRPPDSLRMPEADNITMTSKILSEVPGYYWSFGCSPTSAAMMAGFYDRSGFINIYSGPTNNGLAPMDNSTWGNVVINGETRAQCPLSATRMGVDGRTARGHVDDYWISYLNTSPDPYITNGWTQHAYDDCTGDFMKTSQSVYGLQDGATSFQYNWDGTPRSSTQDGTYGLKLFFESRGYVVTNYYNQLIYGYNGNTLGFTFAQYRQEIDAGRPVLIQVSGHTMLGFGYDSIGNNVYLHDTWDYSTHTMTWGGSYSGLQHYGVSVISIQPVPMIVITSPNGGEFWQPGSTDTLTWNDNISENVRIELYKDGVLSGTIAASAASTGSYIWTIPADQSISAGYQVKITSTGNNNLFDFSNSNFSIAGKPVITTVPVSGVTHTSGTSGGNITSDGGAAVTARGVCWSTAPNPAISNSHTTNGSGTGVFASNFTGLTSNTLYYLRAYATSAFGTTYANQVSFTTLVAPTCGSFTVSHVASGGVAPVNKTVTYSTMANMAGLPLKCWITSNLGADHQATAVGDATEASAGWYWQFNRRQGYRHDGNIRTPNTAWVTSISENINWETDNDPCRLELGDGWRIPTAYEWSQVYVNGNWTEMNGAWNSDLKLHDAGFIYGGDSALHVRGSMGFYCTSTQQSASIGYNMYFCPNFCGVTYQGSKADGFAMRCIRDAVVPAITTTVVFNIAPNTATAGGNVTNDGGDVVTVRGVCWGTSSNPTTSGNHTTDSTGTGVFVSHLTGLTANTLYFVRAYATNGIGTSYGSLVSFTTTFPCGSAITINHVAGVVAPVSKTVTYGTVANIPGEPSKCWITSNLGSDHQAAAVSDATESSAGWYWQFNRKQGYKHTGSVLTPSWPTAAISESSDWIAANDPCAIEAGSGWRIPTSSEWTNVDATGGWSTWTDPWNSGLKLHAAGSLNFSTGTLANRGINGTYRSSMQYDAVNGWSLCLFDGGCNVAHGDSKANGFSLRCLRDTGTIISTATVFTTGGSDYGATSATIGGTVTNDGGAAVTARGVCWGSATNPTISGSHYASGTGPGTFTSSLSGLTAHSLYYVRAYAANSSGVAYGNEISFTTTCGSVTVNHLAAGGVSPVDKTVTYGTMTNISGEPSKCWITSNLGADHQATSVSDANETSAGWYWQFNRKQGYKHDGTTRTPNTAWINSINESLDWDAANDPCALEIGNCWRLPTYTEWSNADASGNWTNMNGPWNSGLKLHMAGYLYYNDGTLYNIGSQGIYWSLTNASSSLGNVLLFGGDNSLMSCGNKAFGFPVRCIKEADNSSTIPTVSTVAVSGFAATVATAGGNVTSSGGVGVTTRGVCWSTSPGPLITGNHTTDGGGNGGFVSNLTGLAPNTLYFLRAYATNCIGTSYGSEVSFTSALPYCSFFTVNHLAGSVAPVAKTVTYGSVTNIPGESAKCWITSNLGADHQATSVNDATEASAGWYWQFNRKQGYRHDGSTRTPNTTWITSVNENLDWQSGNDPCAIELGTGWRLPTNTEWTNVDALGNWTTNTDSWNTGLKLHSAGLLYASDGSMRYRGSNGYYWSTGQYSTSVGWYLLSYPAGCSMFYYTKSYAFPLRCIREAPNVPATCSVMGTIAETLCYNALQTITVAGSGTTYTIQNGGNSTMIAGQEIHYLPNTTVQPGGYMRGYIAPSGPFCTQPAMPAVAIQKVDSLARTPEKSFFRIYPNPTNGNFTVELFEKPEVTPALIEVYDMMGSKLLEAEIQSGRTHLFSLGDQVPGIYLVKVLQNNHAGVGKIVRQQGN